jgi:hypothetical protein
MEFVLFTLYFLASMHLPRDKWFKLVLSNNITPVLTVLGTRAGRHRYSS